MTGPQVPLRLDGDDVPMVRFAAVTKRYGSLTVLDALDLDVAANELVSIIGPSGSGKTTVLRMLMTLEEIDDGVIYVDGEPHTRLQGDDFVEHVAQLVEERARVLEDHAAQA